MRFVLINPPSKEKFVKEGRCQHKAGVFATVYPPLSLVMIGTVLSRTHTVKIVDGEIKKPGQDVLINELVMKKQQLCDAVIVNVSTPTVKKDLAFIEDMRKKGFSGLIGLTGIHTTFFAKDFLKNAPVDFIIMGEPETFALSAASQKDKLSLPATKGIAYKRGSEIVLNDNPKPDLNKLPAPNWKLIDYKKYRIPFSNKPYLIVQTGRGCPYSCSFCNAPYYYGKKVRLKSIEKILEELKQGIKLRVNNFFFFHETFNLDHSFVRKLCKAIINEKMAIKWFANSRVDLLDNYTLQLMAKAGCWMISLGIESMSPAVLAKTRKNLKLNPAALKDKIREIRKTGIISIGHFILGLPGDNIDSIKNTIRLSRRLGLDFAVYYIATPFPGSELFHSGYYKQPKWNEAVDYSQNLLVEKIKLKKYIIKAYLGFYLRPKTWINTFRRLGLKAVVRMGFSLLRYWGG